MIHPSDELGLVCLPAGKGLVCAGRPVCTDDSPAALRAARPALAVALPLDEDELRPHMRGLEHATLYNI